VIVTVTAWAYVRFGKLPQAAGLLYGVKPVVIAIVLQAIWALGRAAVKTKFLAVVGVAAGVMSFLGINELLVLLAAGSIVPLTRWIVRARDKGAQPHAAPCTVAPLLSLAAGSPAARTILAVTFGLWPLFRLLCEGRRGAVWERVRPPGVLACRPGYSVGLDFRGAAPGRDGRRAGNSRTGFHDRDFHRLHPGGTGGALVGTVGIFLPAFFFVAISGPAGSTPRRSSVAGSFLDGVNVASLALMAVVTWQLGRAALVDLPTVALGVAAAIALFRFRLNSAWLVLGAAVIGLLTFAGHKLIKPGVGVRTVTLGPRG